MEKASCSSLSDPASCSPERLLPTVLRGLPGEPVPGPGQTQSAGSLSSFCRLSSLAVVARKPGLCFPSLPCRRARDLPWTVRGGVSWPMGEELSDIWETLDFQCFS